MASTLYGGGGRFSASVAAGAPASEHRAGVGEQPVDLVADAHPARVGRWDQRPTAPVEGAPAVRTVGDQERHRMDHDSRVYRLDEYPAGPVHHTLAPAQLHDGQPLVG